jgi:exonuclease III
MKLVSLNIEGGARGKNFFKYIRARAKTADIFCFQEVFSSKKSLTVGFGERTNIFGDLKRQLRGFNNVSLPVSLKMGEFYKTGFRVEQRLAIFYKRNLTVKKHFGKHVFGTLNGEVDFEKGKEANAVQCAKIISPKGSFWLANFHGLSRPGNKLDAPARIRQSKKLVSVLDGLTGPKILCGDFNLMPQTESVKIIERAGMKNLIKKYKIKNTRNSISWKRYHNRQSFADFTFVSSGIKVKNFKVPYVLASDHLPMVLEFEI